MDISMMSVENDDCFDDDDFIGKALSGTDNKVQSSSKIDVSSLISGTKFSSNLNQFNFNSSDTPRTRPTNGNRKRKNFARRCLSINLNNNFSLNDEENETTSFQEFIKSKEKKNIDENFICFKSPKLSNENMISPKNFKESFTLELTPEFDTQKNGLSIGITSPRVPLKSTNNIKQSSNGGRGVRLQKFFSENHASIMKAVQISSSDPTLIGDFTKPFVLPLLANPKHQDLKSISCHILANLLQNCYHEKIESFSIIDCRYPYEYEGGHIKNAINLYTQEQILNKFINNKSNDANPSTKPKRHILIFHCEFSSERAPSLCRFLRNKDRVKNSRVYPNLHYPELYLLDGGYKDFFNNYSHLCEPCAYRTMNSKDHEEDLRKFRAICKSFESKHSNMKRNLRL